MSLLVTIATYHSQPKAEAARIHLAQEGIEAVLINESIVAMDWLLMNAIGGIKLQVASHDAERAANFINTLEAEQRERLQSQATEFIRFNCSECGKPQQFSGDRRGGVETCTKCGRYIDVPELSDEQMIERHLTVDATTAASVVVARKIPVKMEVGCVLAFAYVPELINALLTWSSGQESDTSLAAEMSFLIFYALHVVPPLLFVIAVSNEPWKKFGIARFRWNDSLVALGVWLAATFVTALTLRLLLPEAPLADLNSEQSAVELSTHLPLAVSGSIGWWTVLICFVGLTANSIAEELSMRCYLIPRFEDLFKSPAIAIVLSSVLFASYHMHQGTENLVAVFFTGVVYGVFFCVFRRLWPLVIAHTASNMMVYLNF
jgi:membrane protease YdiL (CAAX protease family)